MVLIEAQVLVETLAHAARGTDESPSADSAGETDSRDYTARLTIDLEELGLSIPSSAILSYPAQRHPEEKSRAYQRHAIIGLH